MSDVPREMSEVYAEITALEASGDSAPRKMGELRKEMVSAFAAGGATGESLGAVRKEFGGNLEDRKAVATAMLCAYYEKNRDNLQHIGGLIRSFDEIFEAWESMVEGYGREALVSRVKDAESKVRDSRLTLDMQATRIRDLEEMNKRLSDRCTQNGVPV
jgi:hypothetical protein